LRKAVMFVCSDKQMLPLVADAVHHWPVDWELYMATTDQGLSNVHAALMKTIQTTESCDVEGEYAGTLKVLRKGVPTGFY
jgi:hypothetical protein